MCNYYVDFNDVANYFKVSVDEVKEIIKFSESNFDDFISDDLLTINQNKIKVKNHGVWEYEIEAWNNEQ